MGKAAVLYVIACRTCTQALVGRVHGIGNIHYNHNVHTLVDYSGLCNYFKVNIKVVLVFGGCNCFAYCHSVLVKGAVGRIFGRIPSACVLNLLCAVLGINCRHRHKRHAQRHHGQYKKHCNYSQVNFSLFHSYLPFTACSCKYFLRTLRLNRPLFRW